MNVYQENGFENRKEYLNSLADDYGVSKEVVYQLAGILGASEDFDALVTEIEDYAMGLDDSEYEDADDYNEERYHVFASDNKSWAFANDNVFEGRELWTNDITEAEQFVFDCLSDGLYVALDDWDKEKSRYFTPETFSDNIDTAEIFESFEDDDYSYDDYAKIKEIGSITKEINPYSDVTCTRKGTQNHAWRTNWDKDINLDESDGKEDIVLDPNESEKLSKEEIDEYSRLYTDLYHDLIDGSNADVANNIKKAFKRVGGRVSVDIINPRRIAFNGRVGKDYTVGGIIFLDSIYGDCNRLAEDLTMAYYRTHGGEGFNTISFMKAIKGEDLKEAVHSTSSNKKISCYGKNNRIPYALSNICYLTTSDVKKYYSDLVDNVGYADCTKVAKHIIENALETSEGLADALNKAPGILYKWSPDTEESKNGMIAAVGTDKLGNQTVVRVALNNKKAEAIEESYINENDGMEDTVNMGNELPMDIAPKGEVQLLILEETDGDECIMQTVTDVMAAYQNANKWLDIIKEFLFTDLGCVYFSSYVHNLAHTMPVKFDKFGDILHTIDMKIPYPATEYIPQEPTDIPGAFIGIFMILDDIKAKLNAFIKCTDENYHGMACSAETLLNDIEAEYVPLFKMKKAWENYQDNIRFDKWVGQYVANRSNLSESLKSRRQFLKESKSSNVNESIQPGDEDYYDFAVDIIKYLSDDCDDNETEVVDTIGVNMEDLQNKYSIPTVKRAIKGVCQEDFNDDKMLHTTLGQMISSFAYNDIWYPDNRRNIDGIFGTKNIRLLNKKLFPTPEKWLQQEIGKKLLPPYWHYDESLNESQEDDLENTLTKEECRQEGYVIDNCPYTWIGKDIRTIFDCLGISDEDIEEADRGESYLMASDELYQAAKKCLGYKKPNQLAQVVECIQRYLNDLGWEVEDVSEPDVGSRASKRNGTNSIKQLAKDFIHPTLD